MKTTTGRTFTLIELIMVTVAAFLVLFPVTAMMTAMVRDWQRSQAIKLLQEELHLSAYAVKGVMEEAAGHDLAVGEKSDDITLHGRDGGTVRIYKEGSQLKIGNNSPVVDSLSELEFEPQSDKLVSVSIKITGGNRPPQERTFFVRLRN